MIDLFTPPQYIISVPDGWLCSAITTEYFVTKVRENAEVFENREEGERIAKIYNGKIEKL